MLIRKREDVSQIDLGYKITLGSQIHLKIEEYRKNVRKSKESMVPDVFWKGISYSDLCKIEKELKDRQDKNKIK